MFQTSKLFLTLICEFTIEIYEWAIPENIHTISPTAFRNSEGKGGQGSLNWKSEGMGGYLRWEFRRHGGGFRSGISTGDRKECIP